MTNQHPITPPPELVEKVSLEAMAAFPDDECGAVEVDEARDEYIANFFTQWGADQELEACVEWLRDTLGCAQGIPGCLRAARRPKPPSLAEEALRDIDLIRKNWVLLGGSDGTACPSLTGQVTLAQLDRLAAAAERLAQLEQQIIP
jgi:hypothetical protein